MAKMLYIFTLLIGIMPLLIDARVSTHQDGRRGGQSKQQHTYYDNTLTIRIPTSIPLYIGNNQIKDNCPRAEAMWRDGNCYQLLTRGPCEITEFFLLDDETFKPYCAERLCSPDRVFIFGDQMCHDPLNSKLCPPGRELFYTSFGTPICQCPTGTYEETISMDYDVCEPLLEQTLNCEPGQVYWFKDFNQRPVCIKDPCGGLNLCRSPREQPFVPVSNNNKYNNNNDQKQCFQQGSEPDICEAGEFYTTNLERVHGECSSLERAGFQTFDIDTFGQLIEIYGPLIDRNASNNIFTVTTPSPYSSPYDNYNQVPVYTNTVYKEYQGQSSNGTHSPYPAINSVYISAPPTSSPYTGNAGGTRQQSPGSSSNYDQSNEKGSVYQVEGHLVPNTDDDLHYGLENGSFYDSVNLLVSQGPHTRSRRSPFRYNNHANVITSRLANCRAGASRGINFACQYNILPAQRRTKRSPQNTRARRPTHSCQGNQQYNHHRRCTSDRQGIINGINNGYLG